MRIGRRNQQNPFIKFPSNGVCCSCQISRVSPLTVGAWDWHIQALCDEVVSNPYICGWQDGNEVDSLKRLNMCRRNTPPISRYSKYKVIMDTIRALLRCFWVTVNFTYAIQYNFTDARNHLNPPRFMIQGNQNMTTTVCIFMGKIRLGLLCFDLLHLTYQFFSSCGFTCCIYRYSFELLHWSAQWPRMISIKSTNMKSPPNIQHRDRVYNNCGTLFILFTPGNSWSCVKPPLTAISLTSIGNPIVEIWVSYEFVSP